MVRFAAPWAAGVAAAALIAAQLAPGPAAAAAPPPATLITHVNIVTMDEAGGDLPDASVLVDGGRIVRILAHGAAAASPAAQVIDGHGGWLIPGLIDSHIHYDYDSELTSFLRYGVTTVLSLGDPEEIAARLPAITARIAAGDFPGPHLYATGPIIADQVKFDDPAKARAFVRAEAARGHRFVKIYNGTTREIFDAVVDEARRQDMGVFGHMPRTIPPEYVVSHGLNVLAHMEELFFTTLGGPTDSQLDALTPDWAPDLSHVDALLDLMKRHGVVIIPNLVASYKFFELWAAPDDVFASPEMSYLEPGLAEAWRTQNYARRTQVEKRMLRERLKMPLLYSLTWRASQKGILLVAGTDAPIPPMFPGKSLHEELRLLVATGLTPREALATATRNAGVLVRDHVDHQACIGVIRAGCEADLVLLAADPTADIRNTEAIAGVMSDGRWFSPAELAGRTLQAQGRTPARASGPSGP